jgi:hypothetical protein
VPPLSPPRSTRSQAEEVQTAHRGLEAEDSLDVSPRFCFFLNHGFHSGKDWFLSESICLVKKGMNHE